MSIYDVAYVSRTPSSRTSRWASARASRGKTYLLWHGFEIRPHTLRGTSLLRFKHKYHSFTQKRRSAQDRRTGLPRAPGRVQPAPAHRGGPPAIYYKDILLMLYTIVYSTIISHAIKCYDLFEYRLSHILQYMHILYYWRLSRDYYSDVVTLLESGN